MSLACDNPPHKPRCPRQGAQGGSCFPYLERTQKLATSERLGGRGTQLQEPTAVDELAVIPTAWSMLRMGHQQSLLCCFSWVEDVHPPQDPIQEGCEHHWALPPWYSTCRRIRLTDNPALGIGVRQQTAAHGELQPGD